MTRSSKLVSRIILLFFAAAMLFALQRAGMLAVLIDSNSGFALILTATVFLVMVWKIEFTGYLYRRLLSHFIKFDDVPAESQVYTLGGCRGCGADRWVLKQENTECSYCGKPYKENTR